MFHFAFIRTCWKVVFFCNATVSSHVSESNDGDELTEVGQRQTLFFCDVAEWETDCRLHNERKRSDRSKKSDEDFAGTLHVVFLSKDKDKTCLDVPFHMEMEPLAFLFRHKKRHIIGLFGVRHKSSLCILPREWWGERGNCLCVWEGKGRSIRSVGRIGLQLWAVKQRRLLHRQNPAVVMSTASCSMFIQDEQDVLSFAHLGCGHDRSACADQPRGLSWNVPNILSWERKLKWTQSTYQLFTPNLYNLFTKSARHGEEAEDLTAPLPTN